MWEGFCSLFYMWLIFSVDKLDAYSSWLEAE